MTIRMIINYHNNTLMRASITRFDLHCEKMEFSITEQQVPMLLRLIALVLALQTKQFPPSKEKSSITIDERDDIAQGSVLFLNAISNSVCFIYFNDI